MPRGVPEEEEDVPADFSQQLAHVRIIGVILRRNANRPQIRVAGNVQRTGQLYQGHVVANTFFVFTVIIKLWIQ
ncbi:hypothetical protein TYRP_001476 [Tyrophagus putrescentiae]|nr:hypothetical protein TYRP_001476 [Tyrophagus putrescentiae]